MSRSQSMFRTQTKGLLLRTWHYQRRQHCNTFCNFIIPPIFMILLFVLGRTIKAREVKSLPFERAPKGAFAPRPFNPVQCLDTVFETSVVDGDIVLDASDYEKLEKCARRTFDRPYEVPVFVPDNLKSIVGARDARNEDSAANTGLLSELSLEPYIFPGALRGNQFFDDQTPYDGLFLFAYFRGNRSNPVYNEFLDREENNEIDSTYGMKTIERDTEQQLRSDLYNSWFKGDENPKFSTALTFSEVSDTTASLDVKATVYYNESTSANCSIACPLVSNVMRFDNAIYKQFSPGNFARAFLRRMPAIDVEVDLAFIQLVISITLGFTSHFWFPSFLRFLVFERVSRLRSMMSMMGLKKTQYFFGTYIGLLVQYTASTVLLIAIGAAVGISFFVDNTPISYLVLFFLW